MLFQKITEDLHPLLVQKNKGTSYVIKYKNQWVNGKSRRVSSETVGKILDEETGSFKFSDKYLKSHPEFQNTTVFWNKQQSCLSINPATVIAAEANSQLNGGASYLLLKIAEQSGMVDDLKTVWPETAADILSLAIYFLIHPNLNIDSYSHTVQRSLLPGRALSAKQCTELFNCITFDDRNQYLKLRAYRSTQSETSDYWAFDTTSISSYSQTLHLVKYGYNKEHDPLPQMVLGILMDCGTGEPIDYQLLNGATADVSTLKNLFLDLSNIDVDKINLILDRGFDSKDNLKLLYLQHSNFILAVKSNSTIIQQTFEDNWKTLKARNPSEYITEYGCFARACPADYKLQSKQFGEIDSKVYVHIYFDPQRSSDELARMDLLLHGCLEEIAQREEKKKKNETMGAPSATLSEYFQKNKAGQWKLKERKWLQIQQSSGLFYLVSNSISSPRDCLFKYRSRDVAEKGFNNFKERCSGRRIRCREGSLEAKIFVIYLAVTLRMMLRHRLNETSKDIYKKVKKLKTIPDNSIPEMLDDLNYVKATKCFGTSPIKYFWDKLTPKQLDYYKFAKVPAPEGTFILGDFISR